MVRMGWVRIECLTYVTYGLNIALVDKNIQQVHKSGFYEGSWMKPKGFCNKSVPAYACFHHLIVLFATGYEKQNMEGVEMAYGY